MYDSLLCEIGAVGRHQILTLFISNCILSVCSIITFVPVLTNLQQAYSCVQWSGSSQIDSNSSCDEFSEHSNATCLKWEFDNETMLSTIYSQYGLTCGMEYLVQISVTIYFIGFLLGCPVSGNVADRWGRYPILLGSCVYLLVMTLITPFVPYFWIYCIFRFGIGFGTCCLLSTTFTLNAEETNDKYRMIFSILINTGWSVTVVLVAVVGYFVRDHIRLQLYLCIPILITILLIAVLLKESSRWLLETGRDKRFRSAVAIIARRNGKQLPSESFLNNLRDDSLNLIKTKKMSENQMNFTDIVHYRHLRATAVIHWIGWFLISCGYYTSSLGVGLLGGNIYLALGLNGIIEIPGRLIALCLANKLGRVPIIGGGFVIGGLLCIASVFLMEKPYLNGLLITFNVVGKCAFLEAFEFVWMYSVEIFPTPIRNRGIGMSSLCARVGAMLSPLLLLLHGVRPWAPFLLLGVLCVLVGLLSFFTPETMNHSLPLSLEEADILCKTSVARSLIKSKLKNAKHEHVTAEMDDIE